MTPTSASVGVGGIGPVAESLYSETGPIPPTPTLALVGVTDGYDAPPMALQGEGELLLVGARSLAGDAEARLGGSEYLAQFGGTDRFPESLADPDAFVDTLVEVANEASTLATHDVSHGGLAVTLAEMVSEEAGVSVDLDAPTGGTPEALLFGEQAGRVVVETTDPRSVRQAFDGVAPVYDLGTADDSGRLDVALDGESLSYDAVEITELRDVIERELA